MNKLIKLGLERLLEDETDRVAGKRLGLIANPTTVDQNLCHAADLFHARPELKLEILFGPEHGIRATAQDLIEVGDSVDEPTGLPVRSLYGPTRVPTEAMLSGLDAVVYDIQDVGSRYYTYIWTMAHAMEACARNDIELVVLDRPNPIGGIFVEGNLIEGSHLSFVGLYPIPNRHGMSSGELAGLLNEEFSLGCKLTVIPVVGWRRAEYYDATGLTWILPSPNMPTLDTAIVYPGACLLEGTNLSEGRGTTRPFEVSGAPWVEPRRLVASLKEEELDGVVFREVSFEPTFQKFAGQICRGVQQHVTDRERYRPVRTGYAMLAAYRRLWPESFAWRPPPYEYELERPAIDILAGNSRIREDIENDVSVRDIEASWQVDLARFQTVRGRHLLYE